MRLDTILGSALSLASVAFGAAIPDATSGDFNDSSPEGQESFKYPFTPSSSPEALCTIGRYGDVGSGFARINDCKIIIQHWTATTGHWALQEWDSPDAQAISTANTANFRVSRSDGRKSTVLLGSDDVRQAVTQALQTQQRVGGLAVMGVMECRDDTGTEVTLIWSIMN